MFTGIIEEIGEIETVERGRQSAVLHIKCSEVLEGTRIGDSIAVNGVCLTVTALHAGGYQADVMAETLDRSSLGTLRRGSRVNLERAMAADGRFGGHIVSGHIDDTGVIKSIQCDETAVWYRISTSSRILRYVVEKGSVTIDGISLTVAKVTQEDFSVSIIPHTQEHTILADKRAGDIVNIETDIIGKYVEKLLRPNDPAQKESRLTLEFLAEHGF